MLERNEPFPMVKEGIGSVEMDPESLLVPKSNSTESPFQKIPKFKWPSIRSDNRTKKQKDKDKHKAKLAKIARKKNRNK